jgi:putative hydrolase of the HAD superfamily
LPTRLKAVLFDIDDTLFDRESAQKLTLGLILKKHPSLRGGFTREKLQQAWNHSDDLAAAEFKASAFNRGSRCRFFLKLLDLPQDQADELTDQYLKDYTSLNVPMAGAIELVQELKQYLQIGVVSNSLADVQYGKIETLGLKNLLSCIVLSEELGIRKPDPRIFHHAAALLNVQPSECLFVGDAFAADIVGAKSSGMLACWLRLRDSAISDPKIHPDYTINSLVELLPLLKKDGLVK